MAARLLFWEKKCLEVCSKGVPRGFLSEMKGKAKSFHVGVPRRQKRRRTNSGKSDTRNLDAESIRRRAESMGGLS